MTGVRDGKVRVAMTRERIKALPDLPQPQAEVVLNRIEFAYDRVSIGDGFR